MARASLRKQIWTWAIPLATVAVIPASANAQNTFNPLNAAEEQVEAKKPDVGGRFSMDLIPTKSGVFLYPLRFGHLVTGSETITLGSRQLVRERDYTIDYNSGVVYLKVAASQGESIKVNYRYDHTQKLEGTYGTASADAGNNFSFQFAPGAQFVFGLGQTERLKDGTLITSNTYGMANSFNLGPSARLSGLLMIGEREKRQANDMLGQSDGKTTDIEEGQGTAIIQNLETDALGGKVIVDYQDIDDKFKGFNSFTAAGYDQKQIETLAKEKGLKRTRFGFQDIGGEGFRFGHTTSWVGDATGGITWKNFNANIGGVTLAWQNQWVDEDFNKFNGLREQDRKMLMKEKGLDRTTFALQAPVNKGALTFNNLSVQSKEGIGLYRTSFNFNTPGLKANYSDQRVDQEFTRFGDLREKDKGQLAKERGLNRQAYGFQGDFSNTKFSFNDYNMESESGNLTGRDLAVDTGGFTFKYGNRTVGDEFDRYRAFTNQDKQSLVGGILNMYGVDKPHNNDFKSMGDLSGFTREAYQFGYNSKPLSANFRQLTVSGPSGKINLNEASVQTQATKVDFRHQTSSEGWDDSNKLLWNEQRILSSIDQLDKYDFSLSHKFDSKTKVDFSRMSATAGENKAERLTYGIQGTGFAFNYSRRNVDKDFNEVNRLVDKEKNLLRTLMGFDQTEAAGHWQVNKNLRFDYKRADALSALLDQSRAYQEARASWNLSSDTSLHLSRVNMSATDGEDTTVDHEYREMSVAQKFGNDGKLIITQQQQNYQGSEDDKPDALKNSLAYQTKLNEKTDFKTEVTQTKYDDGTRESSTSNSVAHKINDRVGVSVTDTRIRRDGDAPDETRRDYGFWIDFGKGIKLNYAYKRNMVGENFGQKNTETSLSKGEAGGVAINSASYKHSRIDGKRDQHFGNVNFHNAKPFQFGSLRDVTFYYNTNTQRDFVAWKKEETAFGLGFAIGQVGLNYDYKSQIDPNSSRAIDRVFTLKTDKNDKDKIRGTFKYGVRTMPDDEDIMIRDYSLTFQPTKNFSLNHALSTNPTKDKRNALLGSVPLDERKTSWSAKYQNDPNVIFDLSWNELKRERKNESLRREARFDVTFAASNPSPITFSYALQQYDRQEKRTLAHSFGFSFNQRPGPNQSLSLSLEHYQWMGDVPARNDFRNWGMRLDYSWRF